jgi:hypothetical protein
VAGWPGGRTWIDSSTLMFRLRLPQLISDNDELNVRPKSDDDQMMGRMDEGKAMVSSKKAVGKIGKPIRAVVEWNTYAKNFEATPRENLVEAINSTLLQVKPSFSNGFLQQYADSSSREAFVKSATLQIMSTPEYQLC